MKASEKTDALGISADGPAVTVVMPVFNRRFIIERALDSLQRQTFQDFELLIVDDGSSDGLWSVLQEKVATHDHWRYLWHTNRGVARSRNEGILAALGDYVTFLDSDDELLPEHLQLRWEYFQKHPEVDFIHGGVVLTGPEETHYVVDARDPQRRIHIQECCVGATLFGKRAAFLRAGGFPVVPYSPEFHFLEKVKERFRVEKVDFPTYIYHTEGEDRLCLQQER